MRLTYLMEFETLKQENLSFLFFILLLNEVNYSIIKALCLSRFFIRSPHNTKFIKLNAFLDISRLQGFSIKKWDSEILLTQLQSKINLWVALLTYFTPMQSSFLKHEVIFGKILAKSQVLLVLKKCIFLRPLQINGNSTCQSSTFSRSTDFAIPHIALKKMCRDRNFTSHTLKGYNLFWDF